MKKVTIYTIAEELGVTPSSVSRAFNPNAKLSSEKRDRILELAAKYNFTPNRLASRLSQREIKIGVMAYMDFLPSLKMVESGITAAYEELKEYKIVCDFRSLKKSKETVLECYNILNEFVEKEYDAILVAGMGNEKYNDFLQELYEKNKNIGFIQNTPASNKFLFSSMHNYSMAGKLAAEFLACCLSRSERKNVAVFTGNIDSPLHMASRQNFVAAAREYGLNILSCYDMQDKPEVLRNQTKELFAEYNGKIDGIYISSGASLELCKFVKENVNPYEVTLVTTDVYGELSEYLKNGTVTATIYQNLFRQAKNAMEAMCFYLLENRVPENMLVKPELVLKNNLSHYMW